MDGVVFIRKADISNCYSSQRVAELAILILFTWVNRRLLQATVCQYM